MQAKNKVSFLFETTLSNGADVEIEGTATLQIDRNADCDSDGNRGRYHEELEDHCIEVKNSETDEKINFDALSEKDQDIIFDGCDEHYVK